MSRENSENRIESLSAKDFCDFPVSVARHVEFANGSAQRREMRQRLNRLMSVNYQQTVPYQKTRSRVLFGKMLKNS